MTRQAAQTLKAKQGRIVQMWTAAARAESKAARSLDDAMLIDSVPTLLENLSEALAHGEGVANLKQSAAIGSAHGRQRAQCSEYSLNELLVEYRLLSSAIFTTLREEEALDGPTEDLINDAIHRGIANASAEFLRMRRAAEAALLAKRTGELEAAQEHLRTLYQGVKDYAIFTLDPAGVIKTWNAGAARMKQYSADEAIGAHFSMLYPEEARVRDEPAAHLKAAAIEGRFRGEGVRRKKSGELFLADVLITPMYRGGQIMGFSKVVQDLSERARMLQERDLSRSRIEALEAQERLRKMLVAGLAHDLRSPLSAASAGMQLLARTPCDQTRHMEFTARALQNIQRADRMLSDLLDASRVEAGERLPVRMEQCDLASIAREVAAELATVHGDRFVVKPPTPVTGYWDCAALRRVIENLASNAVKYGDARRPVTIAAEAVKDRVLLKVHNFGNVIQSEERDLIFEQFRRAGSAYRETGWGLGLTLVRGITEAHGGIVKVESYPKEGTTFTVDLPADGRNAEAPQQPGEMAE